MKKPLRTLTPILALLVIVAGSVPVAGEEGAARPPRILVREEVVHVGEVTKGDTRKAVFKLENVGGETLKILRAKPG